MSGVGLRAFKGGTVCLVILLAAHAAFVAAGPLWGYSNGDEHNTFAAVGWQPLADLASYAQLYGADMETQSLNGVVDSAGTLYAAVNCLYNLCPEADQAWYTPEVNEGIYAVSAAGERLWAASVGIGQNVNLVLMDYETTLGLISYQQLSLNLIDTASGEPSTITYKDGSGEIMMQPSATWDLQESVVYAWGGPSRTLYALSYTPCGNMCAGYDVEAVWTSISYPDSDTPTPIAAIARDASRDLLFLREVGCRLYRISSQDGSAMLDGVPVAETFGASRAAQCQGTPAVNPDTGAVIVSGTLTNQTSQVATTFVAAVYGNGVLQWHHFLGSNPSSAGSEATYVSVAIESSGSVFAAHVGSGGNITVTQLTSRGAVVYTTLTITQTTIAPRRITLLGSVLAVTCGVLPTSGQKGVALFHASTGVLVHEIQDVYNRFGFITGVVSQPVLPGLGGQLISVNGWSAFEENCEPQGSHQAPAAICSMRGVCNSESRTCNCTLGYNGTQCQTCAAGYWGADCAECAGGPALGGCGGRGTCDGSGTHSGTGVCKCTPPFSGSDCTLCPVGHGGPECQACPLGLHGALCSGHGRCNGTIYGTNQCQCENHYARPDCGGCESGWSLASNCTACEWGHVGAQCDPCPGLNVTAHEYCSGRGVCSSPTHCSCTYPWGGAVCDTCAGARSGPQCQTCQVGYYGPTCNPCPGNDGVCSGHGVCDGSGTVGGTGQCKCSNHFAPPDCSTCAPDYYLDPNDVDVCILCPGAASGSTCGGHGQCLMYGGCACDGNFMSPNCTECAAYAYGPDCKLCPGAAGSSAYYHHPCSGHGSCAAGMSGSGLCTCDSGYGGKSCADPTPVTWPYWAIGAVVVVLVAYVTRCCKSCAPSGVSRSSQARRDGDTGRLLPAPAPVPAPSAPTHASSSLVPPLGTGTAPAPTPSYGALHTGEEPPGRV